MIFPDSLHGFGVGTDGAIIKYKPSISSVQDEEEYIPEKFILQQSYPNPFNPSATIAYQIPELSLVTIKVYDLLGREVVTLVDEFKPAGKYETEFNAANLPSGVYFYQLKSGGFIQSMKMVLMK
jgi:hypothetical protein